MQSRPVRTTTSSTERPRASAPQGGFVPRDGELFYRISDHHRGEPFLVSLASDTDLWMFVTSGGGLTAGRVDAERALFPYVTVDRLHQAHHHTGPVTLIRSEGHAGLWRPFADRDTEDPAIERNLLKSTLGNQLVFEEMHHGTGLALSYRWAGCDAFGWVRTVTLENRSASWHRLRVLDGVRNVLPAGAPLSLYQTSSNLVDAYKTSEVDAETGLGLFALTAGITDRAEALESLTANVAWCCGLDDARVHLTDRAINDFRHGRVLPADTRVDGRAGHYLVSATVDLAPGAAATWHLGLDAARDHTQIAELRHQLADPTRLAVAITDALDGADRGLRAILASADGLQLTGRPESWSHHLANVLFNSMRGGVFNQNHDVGTDDFARFLATRNHDVADRHRGLVADWPAAMPVDQLHAATRATGDADLQRLAHEYLPLYFGRRHGDPSRPWNSFHIEVRDRNGHPALNHEGNWRDIFQNWEALARSFPGFLPSLVARFVNASTVDGFNPYRITRDGVDWETVDPDDPWSNIGYWGDHQIIYLLKLLEALHDHQPQALDDMLGRPIYSYADVPYRLRPLDDLLRDPADTIVFDDERHALAEVRTANLGTDGKLLVDARGRVQHANLLEKLLVPALSKLSNLIPGAGIWMNTQRPEWNDANNALAGGAASVVTLCYLRRYLTFLDARLAEASTAELPVAAEVADWFEAVLRTLDEHAPEPGAPRHRRAMLESLGRAFEAYRDHVDAHGLSTPRPLPLDRVRALCRAALAHVDASIAANQRDDGLYHTYNLPRITDDGVTLDRLPVMLEGQVAVLSSGALTPADALPLLEQLYASDLYREDQHSFVLYPAQPRPGFLERNHLPADQVAANPLLTALLERDDRSLVRRDRDGVHHFHGAIGNAQDVGEQLDRLAREADLADLVAQHRQGVLDLFESVFHHRSYTGRSGVMTGYEGLGCIYWHMVAKLLLAVQENVERARRESWPAVLVDGLTAMYRSVRAGLGYEKSVAEYGAFPTDPYSHTPPGGGAKQPGMTGQVKEEILTRLGELGVTVAGGLVSFAPTMLGVDEFVGQATSFAFVDRHGREVSVAVPAGALAFTFCQVPVVYVLTDAQPWLEVNGGDRRDGHQLSAAESASVLSRDGQITSITVGVRAAAAG